ncbi:unnamed protein product [Rangifer tarandus platyrhynchus]|uniref:Uncharacterized protein n=1 Tax=Rangifer tarandus platyrhynchus TaxID=3082113 RepID=A0ABN9A6C1_RANTA|nr:unnamed protein product [Rangifer tarandus platyrhynchus]
MQTHIQCPPPHLHKQSYPAFKAHVKLHFPQPPTPSSQSALSPVNLNSSYCLHYSFYSESLTAFHCSLIVSSVSHTQIFDSRDGSSSFLNPPQHLAAWQT